MPNLHVTARPDATKLSCLCRVCVGDVNWTIAVNVLRLHISVRDNIESSQFTSAMRRDETVLSSRAARCELLIITFVVVWFQ